MSDLCIRRGRKGNQRLGNIWAGGLFGKFKKREEKGQKGVVCVAYVCAWMSEEGQQNREKMLLQMLWENGLSK
jgi:hypothetical protein